MSGYFTACGRVWKPTVVHLGEQLITIGFVAYFLAHSPAGDIEKNCAAVMLGNVCGDVISFVCMLTFYLADRHSARDYSAQKPIGSAKLRSIAMALSPKNRL